MAAKIKFESLKSALAGNLVGRLVQVVSVFLSAVVLARLLGPQGLGIVAIVSAAVRLAVVPAQEGAARLCERELAGAIGRDAGAQARAAIRLNVLASIGIFALGGGVIVLLLRTSSAHEFGGGLVTAAIALLAATIASAALRGVLRGEGQTTWAIGFNNAVTLATPLFYLAFVGLSGTMTPAAAIWLQVAAKLAFLPLLVLLIRRYWGLVPEMGTAERMPVPRGWLWESLQFTLLGIIAVAWMEIGVLMIGYLGTPEEAGIFRIASRIFLIAGFVTLAAQQAYGPRIAREWQAGNRAALEQPSRMISVLALVFTLCFVAIFALVGEQVIVLAFGEPFRPAYLPALIMALGAVSTSFGAVSPRLLKMTGEQRIVILGSTVALALTVGLNWVLIPIYGATGCAMAYLVSVSAARVILNLGVRRHTGFSPLPDLASAARLWQQMKKERSL